MIIKEHPVEKFDDNKIRHSGHSVMEVVDASESKQWERFAGYTKEGFYFIDESESEVIGPFKSFDGAVKVRDIYFKEL